MFLEPPAQTAKEIKLPFFWMAVQIRATEGIVA